MDLEFLEKAPFVCHQQKCRRKPCCWLRALMWRVDGSGPTWGICKGLEACKFRVCSGHWDRLDTDGEAKVVCRMKLCGLEDGKPRRVLSRVPSSPICVLGGLSWGRMEGDRMGSGVW